MVISETNAEAAPTYAVHKTSKKAEGECSSSNILLLLSAYGWLLKVIGSIKMSLLGKVETVVEAKVPAAKFHKLFSCKPHVVASMSPQSVRYHLLEIFSC